MAALTNNHVSITQTGFGLDLTSGSSFSTCLYYRACTTTDKAIMIISRRKLKLIVFTATLFYITTILVSLLKHLTSTAKLSENQQNGQIGKITKNVNSRENLIQRLNDEAFNPDLGGVLVFWHIQRTGGTYFNTQLVRLNITPSCECYTNPPFEGSCRCRNTKGEAWLFSRFTASSSCGVHPPLVDLALCVPNFLSAAEGHDEATRKRYI